MNLGLSSVFGIFTTNFHILLIVRIAQSAGAGAMAGLGLVLASRYIPYERQGRATLFNTLPMTEVYPLEEVNQAYNDRRGS
ncbi:hypothetical protein [Paenibacillus sp. yr247]|uniref:hypothetical protein n=1 Tax=Paenibacillus sp. yr247 TaxID=1761880 RepID=UPI001587151F|nr:hypothetical protein [Paenibacillus sp. yr247]